MFDLHTYNVQPAGMTPISWGNPLTRALRLAISSNNQYTLSQSLQWQSKVVAQTSRGPSLYYDGNALAPATTNSYGTLLDRMPSGNTDATIISIFMMQGSSSVKPLITINTRNEPPYHQVAMSVRADNRLRFEVGHVSGSTFNAESATLTNGVLYTGVGIRTASTVSVSVNGTTTTTSASLGFIPNFTGTSFVGHAMPGVWNEYFNGNIYFLAVWDRALSNNEVLSISRNPWQLFQRKTPIFTPTGDSGVLIPDLSSPGVIDVTSNSAKPELNVQY